MKKQILTSIFLLSLLPIAQLTFTDLNFKTALINHTPPIDLNNDDEITSAEAQAYQEPQGIDVRSSNITSVQGIEHFTRLTKFTCESNPGLTPIDVSALSDLQILRSHSCALTSVNVTGLTKQTEISIHNNKVTSQDLPAGIYTLQIIGDDEIGYAKFIKKTMGLSNPF